ncbi:MAG: hypothetical protein K2J63_10715 [Muribaculaceae bacterium]|nr:hypothetical protein [Muribaculaceae bacterium]
MKKFLMMVILSVTLGLAACSNADDATLDVERVTSQSENRQTRTQEDSILTFESWDEFQTVVDALDQCDSEDEKMQWVNNHYPNFTSIQDLYWEAMHEAGELDDSQDAYDLFCDKYSDLYFPDYLEDIGYYIPMTDLNKAFLVNIKYEVSIAGEIVNMRDITDYETLVNLGRALYSPEVPMTIGTMGSFSINDFNKNSVGPEYDSGWETIGRRKVKLKARRRFKSYEPIPGGKECKSLFHLEFCFRRKRDLGWLNYSCRSKINFKASIPGVATPIEVSFEKKEWSSHDYEFAYPIAIWNDATHWYYTYVETPCTATVDFKDINQLLNYSWNMPGIQCVTPISANHAPITPIL